jgi:hypothetical protein
MTERTPATRNVTRRTISATDFDDLYTWYVGDVVYTHTCPACGDSESGTNKSAIEAVAYDHEPYEHCVPVTA